MLLQVAFTAASALLFKATKNHTYFKNITIVIPKKWKQLDSNLTQPSLGTLGEHVRVDRKNRAKGNAPYVRGNLECGKPGWFMHLTPDFLNTHGDTAYGPHGIFTVYLPFTLCYINNDAAKRPTYKNSEDTSFFDTHFPK